MKKLLITTALLFTALPFTFDGVTPTVLKAHAILGRPLTPFSVAGVHRRAMHRRFAYGYHPLARAAAVDAAAYGTGWGSGLGWGWNRPWRSGLYAYAGAAPGWRSGWGWGWNRPWRPGLYAYAGAAPGWAAGVGAVAVAGVGAAAGGVDGGSKRQPYLHLSA
jgi:hypothetical protein